MSAAITGTQPNQTNDQNRRPSDGVNDAGPKLVAATPPLQELTPDRPPQSVEAAASATAAPAPDASAGKAKRRRGFAAMDRTLVSEIARKGGKAAHSAGTAHEFTTEEAREAGRKGGRATHAKRTGASTASTAGSSPEREGAR